MKHGENLTTLITTLIILLTRWHLRKTIRLYIYIYTGADDFIYFLPHQGHVGNIEK